MSRSIAEHYAAIMALPIAQQPVPAEVCPPTVPVDDQLLGKVLAQDAVAALPVPPWSNSAMDGFVLRRADFRPTPFRIPVVGDVPAGAPPQPVPAGAALRIMTGAAIPEGADLVVVPVEDTDVPPGPQPLADAVTITRTTSRTHIRPAGENLRPGEVVAPAGTRVDGATIAALLSAGVTEVVKRRPVRVGIVSSGDELVDGADLAPGQLPDSNGPMLEALVHSTCSAVVTRVHCADDATALAETIESLSASHELIITTGGVSAGAFDVVHETLGAERAGDSAWFGHVEQKPGAPQGLSTFHGTAVVSLPGNPVAAFASFHLYLTPLLRCMAGLGRQVTPWERPWVEATAAAALPAASGRTAIVPVHLSFGSTSSGPTATPFASGLGSHLVASLAGTGGFAVVDSPVPAGDRVKVYLY